jgi:dTDP-4-dehydrorhamnose reductase
LKKPVVLVTGAKGQLGSELQRLSANKGSLSFLFIDKDEVDLCSSNAFIDFAQNHEISYVINCAAYTAVDLAETEVNLAKKINSWVPSYLAEYCRAKSIRLIHVSTDYVYDGHSNKPLLEDHAVNPLSVYGESKLEGDINVLSILANAYIIRTSWVYSVFGKNFVKTMLSLGKQREQLNVVIDQIGSPTSAHDLANAIIRIIENIENGNDHPGIYHYSNEGVTSWFDFATAIFEIKGMRCKVNPIPSKNYPTPAIRPSFTVLDKSKIKKAFNIEIPHWRESLKRTLKELEA